MSDLDSYRDVLPAGTFDVWTRLAPMLPDWMYLIGGTALATHLHHRVSRDLDLFAERSFDAEAHARLMAESFPDFVPTDVSEGTVNGVLGGTKVQLIDASSQHRLVDTEQLAGIRVAGIEDILATKLKVVMDRGALRDYFDLMRIEEQTDLDVVGGMSLNLERYRPATPDQHIFQIVRALGYLDDVDNDPGLPVTRRQIEKYWLGRQPDVIRRLGF